jgi:hypothetical protein
VDQGLRWLVGELDTVLTYLDQFPQERPKEKAEGAPQYAAGLRDMAHWIKEKAEHEAGWMGLRECFAETLPDFPAHSSKITLTRPKRQRKR